MSLNLNVVSHDSALDDRFKRLTKVVSMLLTNEGKYQRPYLDGLPHFSKLATEQKTKVVEHLQFFHDLCIEHVSEGYSIKDSPSFVWRAFRRLGLTPRSDLFSQLTDEHIVEIYSNENVQLFRNFKFFEFCSYSLEELLTIEWWGLFDRDSKLTTKMYEYAAQIFNGELHENVKPALESHFVRELASQDKLAMEYSLDLVGPLYRNKRPEALIILERAKLVSN
ncbi:MAG TPA: hypothetical protein VF412_09290 [Bdellovibrio sp.]|uniref:hypothetical protein n=1 Tax=Bdellovibrio sp. TaxID=28201 RepID=UPI002EE43EFC